jgi:hypothetical protein
MSLSEVVSHWHSIPQGPNGSDGLPEVGWLA